jgi:predicted DNA-binding transcriptional regulator AlpA
MNYNIVALNIDDFKNFISTVIRTELQEQKQNTVQMDKFMTIEDVVKYLKISSVTLWKWSKNGKLPKHYINGLPRYKRSEIEEKFVELKRKRA